MSDKDIVKDYTDAVKKESEKAEGKRTEIINRRRRKVIPRKYHLTPSQIEKFKKRFDEHTQDVSKLIKEASGSRFFNPFRRAGIYYGCVQSLYLLGSNKWHEYVDVYNQMSKTMKKIVNSKGSNSWDRFCNRSPRKIGNQEVLTSKDDEGRIKQNFRVLQRLGGIHPYGYKLMQACSCIDIKRHADGKFYFKLNTSFKLPEKVVPFYDCKYKKPRKITKKKEIAVVQSNELADQIVTGVMDNE
ncbi:hypothetical protein LCGC14_0934730 [marine sediment metagenome]|uniref:Uncharacterized protein n=1 Tax=marine sediment metagenome TaxID=412755 RepID=A0A0F9R5D2_9ZZZZ